MDGAAEGPSEIQRAELIARLKVGEPAAYEEFMADFGPALLRFGKRMCGDSDDAQEVLQDTLLKTFESIGTLKNPGAFRSWLYRILANACLMRRRKSQFMTEEIPLEETLPEREGLFAHREWEGLPERVLQNSELAGAIQKALLELPPDYRLIILMRDVEGLTTQEAADALGVSPDVAKMRLHRARAKMRNALDSYLGGSA